MPAPTVTDLRTWHPVFADVADVTVEAFLDDAVAAFESSAFVNERNWFHAVMLLAAHNLTLSGAGTGVEAAIARNGAGGFTSVSDGAVSASRPAPATGKEAGTYDGTSYGQRLSALIKRSLSRSTVAVSEFDTPPLGSPSLRWRT